MNKEDDLTNSQEEISAILLLGRIDGKLDSALNQIRSHDTRIHDLQKEINALNRWKSYTVGILTMISLVAGFVANRVSEFVFGG